MTVVLPEVIRAIASAYIDAGVKVVLLPMRKLIWPMKSIITFLNLFRSKRYDIVHVHSQEAGVIARCLSWLGRAQKRFYTPQTIDIRQSHWHSLYIILECMLALISTRIFSVNQADAKRMIKWGIPTKKVTVIPNGIELSQYKNLEDRETICRRLGLNPDNPVVMQLGRISHQKNPDMFLSGAIHILSVNTEVQLVWIGEGPLFTQVQSRVESLRLQDKIHLLGRIDQAYHCLVAADVVTSTSRWEGMPYSILEAMACSKPVVSPAVNGCPEIVINGQTGYLVEVGDSIGWANSILYLIANPQQAQLMGSRGRRLVEEKYSLPMMVSQIEHAYINS